MPSAGAPFKPGGRVAGCPGPRPFCGRWGKPGDGRDVHYFFEAKFARRGESSGYVPSVPVFPVFPFDVPDSVMESITTR
jgi:hypothetical protein